jgi:isopentenyl diphosphate isomerase/L-lactate dehydrogenase-like FMN-dependent dehydrogenase
MNDPRKPLQTLPADLFCAQDYERLAPSFMPHPTHAYVAGGSGLDITVAANRDAFERWAILPRLLRDVRTGHTRLQLNGREMAHPVMLAPVAFQRLAHPRAELESARAAAATDSCLVASTLSSFPLEEIAAQAGERRWFQLYMQPARARTLELVRRAHEAGYEAIVVTLDASIQSPGRSALQSGFRMPADCVAANLRGHDEPAQADLAPGASRVFQGAMHCAPTWDDLDWLLAQTPLPVWIKGVLSPLDARALVERGVSGIVVSNHGGRSIDGAPASLDALPAIRRAVGAQFPLLLDSGIRCGGDIFKALALGANAVLVGRLQMYALAVAGALGVAHMIRLLREELEVCMAQAGCASLAEIGSEMLAPAAQPLA